MKENLSALKTELMNDITKILMRHSNNAKIAVIEERRTVSYSDLARITIRLSKKIKNFVRVMILLPNSIEFIQSYFALQLTNAVIFPIFYKSPYQEIHSSYQFCECDLIITTYEKYLNELCRRDINMNFYTIDTDEFFINDIYLKDKVYSCKGNIVYRTSGSTSSPKFVEITNDAIINNVMNTIVNLEIVDGDCLLITTPMAFSSCWNVHVLTHLVLGATLVIKPDKIFSKNGLSKFIQRFNVNSIATVPSFIISYCHYLNCNFEDLIKKIYIGADYIGIGQRRIVQNHFQKAQIYITYGMTEAGPRVSALKYKDRSIGEDSVGPPSSNNLVKIIKDGYEQKPYQRGEIIVSSPSLMKGYFRNEELTKKTIVDNFLYTGDYGYLDYKGNLYMVGRTKNIFKISGMIIHPEEIESIINLFKGIKSSYVSIKVVNGSKKLIAYYEVDDKKTKIKHEHLKFFCEEKLREYMVTYKFIYVEKLNRTVTGKLKREREDLGNE